MSRPRLCVLTELDRQRRAAILARLAALHRRQLPPTHPVLWTDAEFGRIRDFASDAPGFLPSGIETAAFCVAWAHVYRDTLMGPFWVLRLTAAHVRIGRQVKFVSPGGKPRYFPELQRDTLEALCRTFPPERELLFPWHATRSCFVHLLRRHIFIPAGIPAERRFPGDRRTWQCD